jgi:hypothetical protein
MHQDSVNNSSNNNNINNFHNSNINLSSSSSSSSIGGGGGAAGLLMVILPPVPGDAISSAPQPATRAAAAVAYTIPRNFGFNILNLRNK